MDLTTDYLRTLIAVCACKSFSRATARVHKSQAAISTQIAKLEEQAGSKFIEIPDGDHGLTAFVDRIAPEIHKASDILNQTP